MSLIIKRHNPYDDSADREAFKRFCNHKISYELWYDSAEANIDGFLKTPNGYAAIELAHNACWTHQLYYPENEDIHIPVRKLKYFCRVLEGYNLRDEDTSNIVKVQKGYFIFFNALRTRAAVIGFKDIFKNHSEVFTKILNDSLCKVITVPYNVLHHINIPTE